MQGSLRYSSYVSAFEDGLCMQLKCSRRRNHPSCQKEATRPQSTAYANRRSNHVLKHGSKRSRDSDPRRIDHEEDESDPSEPDTSWHGAVFGDGCTYWHTELLQLVEKYIKRNLRQDNGGLHLGRAYLDHLSSLLLRCVFRAKLQHVHRDIDEVVKVLQVPPTLHTALNIEGRHGFAVFPGICFRGHLAHPRMCRNLEGCDVLLVKSLLSRTVTDLSLEYNDIRDFGGVLGCVDVQVERLCSAGVKLVLCSGSISAEISQKFHMRGISCVSNVDFGVLSQLALALARPLVDSLDKCFEISKHVGRIDSFKFVQKSDESVAAISVNANFHGCTILYSTSRLTWANAIKLKELLSTALFRLQGVFEELMFVKDLEGSLDVGNATCFHLESARGILSRRSSISMGAEPTLQRRNSLSFVRSPCSVISGVDSNATPRSTLTGSVVYSRRKPKCRPKRFRDIVRGSQRIDIFKWDSHRRINGHQVHLHFSDWLSQHLLGVLVLPTAVENQGDPGGNLKEQSILHCFEYFTKFSEICGNVTRRTVPVGRYTAGSFVSDFVLAYARHLRRDNCLSSESCSEQLSRHVMHLETSNAAAPVQHKRLRVLVDNRDTGLRPAESGCPFFIHTHCRSCGKADILPVNDLTFGRFVHLLLYNRCYTSKCGHNLFGGHDFSLRAERFTLYMQVEDITNYQIGAWFDSQLLNCGMGFMPLSSAGMSLHNRRLLQVSSKLLKVFEDYSDVDLDTNFESSDAVCRDTPRGPASPRPPTPDFNWEPYDEQEMDMLYLKDRSSMLGLALRNLFKMVKACLRSRFAACVSTVRLEDVLPCRCELGGNSSSRKLDNRNQWSSEFVMKSMQHLMQLFEERNAFGLYLHPLLLDGVGAAFGGAGYFGFCGRCQKAKFSSIADIEILNWIYIFTSVVRCLGVKLHNLSSALRQSLTPRRSSDVNNSSQAVALSTTEHERASSVHNRVIGKTVDAIDDCLESIRSIYEQCVSHLLFAQLWCPLDPLQLLMTVRSFFVALTSLCRSTVRMISRVPGWALLKTMRFIDTGTIVVALKTKDCVKRVESGSSHGQNGVLRTGSAGNDESETRKSVGVSGQSGGEANGGPSTTATDDHTEVHHEACDSDPSRPHIVEHHECASQSDASARLIHGSDPHDPHRRVKDGLYTVWGAQIYPQQLFQLSGNQQMRDAGEPSVNALSGSGVATSCTDASRNYTLPHFIHYALNTSITAGFVGQSDEWFGSPSSLWHMLSRMRIGCPKRMSSVVSLSYGIVHNLRRDVCNVISAAIMSQEYLEQCSSHFQGPVSANLCSMGKCLLNYCKNQDYSIMANISCGPHRDDIFGVSVEGSHSAVTAQANRRHGGLLMDSLVFRYLKRHSHLTSFLLNSADCAVRLREIEMDGALVVRRWDDLHSSLPSSPWCSMAGSASELRCANLLCFWKCLRVIGDDPLLCVSKDSAAVFCPITRPCYGTPIVCCSNRLSRYQWSKHDKVFGQVPVMDHAIKLLRGNMASKRDVLRTVVDWTCRQLESACYQRSRTHAMVAYVESQVGFICNREFGRVQVTGDAELPLAAFTVEPFAPGGYTPCSPFFQESPCIGLSPGRQYFTLSSFSSRDGDFVGLIRGTSAVEPVVPMPAAKVGGAFERHRVPAGKDLSKCTSITLTSAHTSCDVTLHYPEAFHSLRHLSCGDDTSFARSLCRSSRLRCSGGKSGAPLFVSHDGKFILKLLNKYEFQLFVDSGARFFEHVLGGGTLLSIPLGLFSIRYRNSGNTVRCLVMQNVDHVLLSHKLTFDLKGISFKRCVNLSPNKHSSTAFTASGRPTLLYDNASEETADVPNQVVLLDQNFKDFTNGCPIRLEEASLLRILDFVQRDLTFLSQLDVVDYSLLLRLYPAEGVVVLGIIDYLRPYTWDKQIETIGKKLANIAIGQEPTIVSPVEYRSRFMRFFSRIFWLSPEVEERAPTPVRVPKPVRRSPPVCRCTVCAALASLYTTPYVTSLSHYMLGTSPLAKRYLRSLIASSTPCMSTAEAASELAKLLRTIYDDAVLDVRYSSV